MIGWLKDIFSDATAKVVDKTMNGIDNLFTSDEERLIVRKTMEQNLQVYNLQLVDKINEEQQAITDRHANDMMSDNWLSKTIRPASLIYLLVGFTLVAVLDGNWSDFILKEQYVSLLGSFLQMGFGFYFGGRSVEKIAKILKGSP